MNYVAPQVNFPERRQMEATRSMQRPRRESQVNFDTYLKNWQQHIKGEQDKLRKLCEMAVTMHRRFRGLTLSDLCGRYGIRRNTDGKWLDYDADRDGEIHPINVVQPAIRANTNACLQSNPVVEVSSANQEAKHKQIAMRWQRVSDFFVRDDWDEDKRCLVFDGLQKEGSWLFETYCEESDSVPVTDVQEGKTGIAQYQCQGCGMSGIAQIEAEEPGMTEMPCPECGSPANAMVKEVGEYHAADGQLPKVQIKTRPIPFFNFVIDRYNAKLKGVQGAKWLQIQELVDRMELETSYPQHDFTSPMQWSYQTQCDYALANSDWRYLNFSPQQDRQNLDFDRFERISIYLHEDAYSNYVAPSDYEFINGAGERVFSIKKGQTIAEAWEALYQTNPRGLKFVWEGERLLDIVSPKAEEINFRVRFSDAHWLRDSSSYLSAPNYSIVIIQDDITLLNTMNHNIIARNAVIPTYYDSLVFDDADFSKEYVGSKNAHLLPDRDMSKAVIQLPIPTPSPHLSNQLAFLWEVKDSVSQVQPALRGEAQKGETFGAQRQQLEQSYGLLTSVLKSFAGCLTVNFKQKARLAAKHWTLEQFQRVGSMWGELWTDEDVQEMCEIDFEEDLIVSYQNGSEMPQTNLGREMKFFQGLAQLMPFVQAMPQLLGTDKLTKILQKIDEYAEFDFDLTGLEVNELVAQKRVLELAMICKNLGPIPFEQIELAKQTVVGQQPEVQTMPDGTQVQVMTPVTQLDVITEQIFYQSKIRFSQYEDLEQQKAFFIEQLRAETGKTTPDYLFLEMLQVLIAMLEQAVMQQQQEAMMNDPQLQLQLALKAEEDKKAQADADREDAKGEQEREAAEADQQRQFAQSLVTQGMAQEHELEKTALQGQIQAANKPKKK